MGKQSRAKSERRRERQTMDAVSREMDRQGVYRRHGVVESVLRSSAFIRGWREAVAAREGTEREVEDLAGAHAVVLEVLGALRVDARDVRITMMRSMDDVLHFFCRPDSTRIAGELNGGGAARAAA